jgi:hypothetical protein
MYNFVKRSYSKHMHPFLTSHGLYHNRLYFQSWIVQNNVLKDAQWSTDIVEKPGLVSIKSEVNVGPKYMLNISALKCTVVFELCSTRLQ